MWAGDCSCCGICCVNRKLVPEFGRVIEFRCANLLVSDTIGRPGATFCAIWDVKRDGTPITMQCAEYGLSYPSKCLASYPRPHDAVPPECSYEFVPDELVKIRPAWEMGYLPELKEQHGEHH